MISRLPRSFLRYVVVGLGTNGSLYLLFVALVWAGLPPVLTAGLTYVLGVTLSYVLNRAWSFQSTASHGRDLPRFLISYGIGFVATMGFIALLTKWLRPEVAQIFNIGLTAVVIYLSLRFMGFGRDDVKNDT